MSRRRISLLPAYCVELHSAEPGEAFTVKVTCPAGHIFVAKAGTRYYYRECERVYGAGRKGLSTQSDPKPLAMPKTDAALAGVGRWFVKRGRKYYWGLFRSQQSPSDWSSAVPPGGYSEAQAKALAAQFGAYTVYIPGDRAGVDKRAGNVQIDFPPPRPAPGAVDGQ